MNGSSVEPFVVEEVDSSAERLERLRRTVGERIRRLRQARALSQEALAARGGLSVDSVRRIERGVFSPSLETLSKIARGLEISLQTMFERIDSGEEDPSAGLCDFLRTRSETEVRVADRVLRSLFSAMTEHVYPNVTGGDALATEAAQARGPSHVRSA